MFAPSAAVEYLLRGNTRARIHVEVAEELPDHFTLRFLDGPAEFAFTLSRDDGLRLAGNLHSLADLMPTPTEAEVVAS